MKSAIRRPTGLMFRSNREDTRLAEWASFESEALPYQVDLYRMAKWLLRDGDAAQDLVQETLVQALRSFHRLWSAQGEPLRGA